MKKYVYLFREGNKDMRDILGDKGANLAEMTNIGLPVPHGFTISTIACKEYYNREFKIISELEDEIFEAINTLEQQSGKKLGDKISPLLLSVRSGTRISMPGMMDTILNLGFNDAVAETLIKNTGDARFVYDSYRRFITMYAEIVKGYDRKQFDAILANLKNSKNVQFDTDLNADDLKQLTLLYKKLYLELDGNEFPSDTDIQLVEAIQAIFRSWNADKAKSYRFINHIPDEWGTAVVVQEMVYGNIGNDSGTGVVYTRNPDTGEKGLYGEYLINAQGEDIISGVRKTESILILKDRMPSIYEELNGYATLLENHYNDMQKMEFTVENGKLYILQTRNSNRTAMSAIKIVLNQVKEGMITEKEAVLRISPSDLELILQEEDFMSVVKDNDFKEFMNLVDKYRILKVKANINTVNDALLTLNFGADGIGLCKTENMFFDKERLFYMRQMILAQNKDQRLKSLEKLLEFQRNDFIELFRIVKNKSITIQYLDLNLHKFLPSLEIEILELANSLGIEVNSLKQYINSLKEIDYRGCRLNITYPEIAMMQTKAIIDAAIIVSRENIFVKPEIMIPLVMDIRELKYIKRLVIDAASRVMQQHGVNIEYHIGALIEVPRACMLADEIAIEAEFFGFGTNDLTELTYGFSRDESTKIMKDYLDFNILNNNPFKKLDENGVGLMVEFAVKSGRKIRPTMELGICGEHGGDPDSIAFCHKIGLNYVSCSPYRIPVAKLAAAHANIESSKLK